MIYTGFNNTGEVEAVYAAKRVTTTGTPPLSFPSKGYDLEDFLISGNTIQNGTPTPDNPVDVAGCGERTGNLFDAKTATETDKYITSGGEVKTGANGDRFLQQIIQCQPDTQYTFSWESIVLGSDNNTPYIRVAEYDSNNNFILRNLINCLNDSLYRRQTITTSSQTVKLDIHYDYNCSRGQSVNDVMLNLGSTAKPYEPYGYKLPIAVNGQEIPIYLGQVPTTRRIKKLVLTGDEDWNYVPINTLNRFRTSLPSNAAVTDIASTHFKYIFANAYGNAYVNSTLSEITFCYNLSTVEDWKSYLATQYAAGTPVTIWYVLATPTTGIVNEPLMKIKDYADTISLSQSGITVSTIAGTNTITTETTVLPSSISVTTPEKEVAEVYAGINYQNPIYYKTRTLTGTLPLSYKALSKPLSDYLISGNTVQNGTPTPSDPVDVVGCGKRTGNLLNNDSIVSGGWQAKAGTNPEPLTNPRRCRYSDFFAVASKTILYDFKDLSVNIVMMDSNGLSLGGTGFLSGAGSVTFLSNTEKISLIIAKSDLDEDITVDYARSKNISLDYGYKLSPTVNGTEYPIYLGQVPTTRRIRKLVLTGNEKLHVYNRNGYVIINDGLMQTIAPYCDILPGTTSPSAESPDSVKQLETTIEGTSCSILFKVSTGFSNIDNFRAWLEENTPTVWYVLATPETAIVNEPLHKIGDYADTISMAQAGVTIPTVAGSNALDMTSTVKPSAISITGNIKPTGYGQLLDVNNVDIQDKNNTPIFIHE